MGVGGQPVAVRIVDAHCHAGVGDGLTGPWDTRAPLGAYRDRAASAGIAHTVLIPVFTSDYAAANRRLAALVSRDPRRYTGLAMIHPGRDAGRVWGLVAEAVGRLGLRGVKVHRHDAPLTREVCEAAERSRLPILYDVMGEVGHVELVAREYPALRLVIPHLGSFGDDWRAQIALISILERHRHVYADTSGVRRFDVLLEAARRAPHKLIFGSDGPWLHPGVEKAKVEALRLPAGHRAAVLGGTAVRVYGIDRPRRTAPSSPGRGRSPLVPAMGAARAPVGAPPAPVGGGGTSTVERRDPWLAQELAPE